MQARSEMDLKIQMYGKSVLVLTRFIPLFFRLNCVKEYYSYKGDLIFDPFGGSGTLGRVARTLDRYCFLTEIEPTYFEYMKSFEKPQVEEMGSGPVNFLSIDEFIKSMKS